MHNFKADRERHEVAEPLTDAQARNHLLWNTMRLEQAVRYMNHYPRAQWDRGTIAYYKRMRKARRELLRQLHMTEKRGTWPSI